MFWGLSWVEEWGPHPKLKRAVSTLVWSLRMSRSPLPFSILLCEPGQGPCSQPHRALPCLWKTASYEASRCC